MATWGELLHQLQTFDSDGNHITTVDDLRRQHIHDLSELTGRSVLVYASDFLGPQGRSSGQTSIELLDMQGLMETFQGLPGGGLDLILHSPGGQAEAVERLAMYMRSKFDHVRVFVPLAAMSAATMWALAADEIVMGKHSQLGPIDPQVTLPSGVTVPAGSLIDQFEEANEQCAVDQRRITGWLPTLQQYPPGLLNVCRSSDLLAKELVTDWLARYMFRDDPSSQGKAEAIAAWLGDGRTHRSHSRPIPREDLVANGVRVSNLEDDQALQDAVLTVHHCVMLTFTLTNAVKLVENNLGRSWVVSAA